MPPLPPTSVIEPEIVTLAPAPKARFSGVSGCRNPGVTVNAAMPACADSPTGIALTRTVTAS